MFVGLRSDWPRKGDMSEVTVFGESVVVVNSGDVLRAFANICPHRGSRLLECNTRQRAGRITCPYHQWVFTLHGAFERFGSSMQGGDAGRASGSNRLIEFSVFVYHGLVFAALDGDADELEKSCDRVLWWLEPFHAAGLNVTAKQAKHAKVNWKLWVENFLECYHCEANHPQLRRMEAFVDAIASGDFGKYREDVAEAESGIPKEFGLRSEVFEPEHSIPSYVAFELLVDGVESETLDGQLAGRPILTPFFFGKFLYGCLGPFFHFTVCVDHVVLFSFNPSSESGTEIKISWIVPLPNESLSIQNLIAPWGQTVDEDVRLVERVQPNFHSHFYRNAQYLTPENNSSKFVNWYQRGLRNLLSGNSDLG